MTLVVARIHKNQIAMAADTLLIEHGVPLSFKEGTIKLCILPGNLCVGFSNSPELAEDAFRRYVSAYPEGAGFSETVSYFENSSKNSGNEYIIAFGNNAKLIKISDGARVRSISSTVWIGDKNAYERFREVEARHRKRTDHGRAINCVLFGDEPTGSPASDLYSIMKELASDKNVTSVGGFISLISHRGPGFRFSIYSDMLFDWPNKKSELDEIDLNEKITLSSTDENVNYSVTQISPLYMDANYVAFYFLHGKLLFIFFGIDNGLANKCTVVRNVNPPDVHTKISEILGFDLSWLVTITSSYNLEHKPELDITENQAHGTRLGIYCHANTYPKGPMNGGLLRLSRPYINK